MPVLDRDIETRSDLRLKQVGAWKYSRDPSTEVLCVAFCVDNGPIKLWVPGDPVPQEYLEAASNPDYLVVAYNDAFERLIEQHILAPRHGFPLVPIERHRCSMATALAHALPGSLEKAAKALDLDVQKDMNGHSVMLRMARPRKTKPGEDDLACLFPRDKDEKDLAILHEYCRNDVAVERALHQRLGFLSPEEQALWVLDAAINDRGVYLDKTLIEAAIRIGQAAKKTLNAELQTLTAGAVQTLDQRDRLIAWLTANGCEIAGMDKDLVRHALTREHIPPQARRVLELRRDGAHAAAAKYIAMHNWHADDGRMHGTLQFHGAATGRWVGRGPQPQNFKRDGENIEAKIAAVMNGGIGLDSPVEAIGDIARAMIVAAPGHRLLIADFSGIESRALAWISGQQSKLDAWAQFDRSGDPNRDPYVIIGRALGHPEDKARAFGKIADLAFGYQGGVGAGQNFAPDDDTSDETTIRRYRDGWRDRHPATVRFWSRLDRAAINAIRRPGVDFRVRQLVFHYDAPFLRVQLPSGRSIRYPFARVEIGKSGSWRATFLDNAGGKFTDCRFGNGAYGGLWAENIVSGIARDLLAAALMRLEAAGYPVVLHVHDEIVVEAPDGFGSVEEFQQLVTTLPFWAKSLPVAAKVRNGPRFAKIDTPKAPRVCAHCRKTPNGCKCLDDFLRMRMQEENIPWTATPPPASEDASSSPNMAQDDIAAVRDLHSDTAGANETYAADEVAEPAPQSHGGNADGYPHGEHNTGHRIAFFVYRHANGQPYLGVKKTSTKQFPQFHVENGRWVKGPPKGPKIPYRLPELIQAPLNAWIAIAAGEKDAETAAALGFVATTNPEGERKGAWAPELNAWFYGRRIAIMEDHDATGEAHAIEVAEALRGIVSDIRIVTFHDLPIHGDLTNWVQAKPGRGYKELLAKIEATPPSIPELGEWDAGVLLNSGLPEPRQWLMSRQFCRGFLSGIVAPGDVGKTTLRLMQAVELASRREILGYRIYQRCRVLVISFEDDRRELHRRLLAICKHHRVDPAELTGWLFCRELNGVKLVEPNSKGQRALGALDAMLRQTIERRRPDLVILDPFVKLHALNENDNPDMDFVCSRLVKLAQDYNIAIDSPAHTHKGSIAAGDPDARRGASAQRDAGRLDYTLTAMTAEEAECFDIDPEERKSYVRLDRAKANIVRAIKAVWFRLISVPLDNATEQYPDGDEVQALEPWIPPDAWQGLDDQHINLILDKIDAGLPDGNRYSADGNAKKRAAWKVVVEVMPEKSKAQAVEIIKTWVKGGLLISRTYENPVERKEAGGLYIDPAKRPAT
jgi:DNA polymerase